VTLIQMMGRSVLAMAGIASLATGSLADSPAKVSNDQSWVEVSNQYSDLVLRTKARFSPESAGDLGVDGLDDEIVDLRENVYER